MSDMLGYWLWSETSPSGKRNAFVRFRRQFDYYGGQANLRITADSRYALYVNGSYIGQGPVRCWPNHWRYDTYDLSPFLNNGRNIIAVLVNHFGEGNFQYIPAPPGLLANLELDGGILPSDNKWVCSPCPAYTSDVPRISVQEAFEEQFDARMSDEWIKLGYDDSQWQPSLELRPAADGIHNNLEPKNIANLTLEPVLPKRIVSVESVKSIPYIFTMYLKPYLTPDDISSNQLLCHAYAAVKIQAPHPAKAGIIYVHKGFSGVKLNGKRVTEGKLELHEGNNELLLSIRGCRHFHEFNLSIACDVPLGFSDWTVIGPFELDQNELNQAAHHMDTSLIITPPYSPDATAELGNALWASGDLSVINGLDVSKAIKAEYIYSNDAFVQAFTDTPTILPPTVKNQEELVSGSQWATIYPADDGSDVRILLDYGREIIGYHSFEISASEGTILDTHNFEFIQPDGRYNLAEGMNNSFRYICREGYQTYQTLLRRGFQYSYIILRNMTKPVHLRRVSVLEATYPQTGRGSFTSSDPRLDRIWAIGANTLRCCSEDTYTDCPTYEQTHWVGDARNEALIDWMVNGDPRLWYRCIEQTAHSLERSPIAESHVPSAWVNILPAWSFLWMRSCVEYFQFTGDTKGIETLMPYLKLNIDGIKGHINERGLFEIRGWNMFDWAAMDTPTTGVVTHQNCLAVQALRDSARLAETLSYNALSAQWSKMADDLSSAINQYLWNDDKKAYTDCMRDEIQSEVYSQQTQTAAYISGVAEDERALRCSEIMHNPPESFVKAGSPFFEFFLLEAYQKEGMVSEFIDTIRRDWGFMADMGATAFWEMWSGREGRLTRSHCHGWSAAPTFFLSTYVLGAMPSEPGWRTVRIAPHPGDLSWCRGRVPTPAGDIEIQWWSDPAQPFKLLVKGPKGLKYDIALPREGTVDIR